MKKEHIQAIGNFLAFYDTDLNYIKKFQDFKEGTLPPRVYVQKGKGTFYSFLTEYGVKRNISNISDDDDAADKLLKETLNWVKGNHADNADNVDRFTEMLVKSKLTRGKKTISLASKILFLNNPWKIIPWDRRTRNAFKSKPKTYDLYKEELIKFRETDKKLIKECLIIVKPLAKVIENDYLGNVKDLNKIRENRIIDKLLMYS